MKIGLIINPLAGIGGAVALKGSDGAHIVEKALHAGADKKAAERVITALSVLTGLPISFFSIAGEMGEDALKQCGFSSQVVYQPQPVTTAVDTREAVIQLCRHKIDLLLFAGGDGTARDVLDALRQCKRHEILPVIGIPAGCKIHSAVYALTPGRAGELVALLAAGEPMSMNVAQVMDLDEMAFRQGKVNSQCYGYLQVPVDDTRMQLSKQGGLDHQALAVAEIATEIVENMQADVLYIIGSGSTTEAIMQQLGLKNTLLGVDVVLNFSLLESDVSESQLLELLTTFSDITVRIIVTVIGGQGHIFGRGNQQLSARVIKRVGVENIIIVATNEKLRTLDGRTLIVDTGNNDLDQELSGLQTVITGYEQKTLVKIA